MATGALKYFESLEHVLEKDSATTVNGEGCVNGHPKPRLPNTLSIGLLYWDAVAPSVAPSAGAGVCPTKMCKILRSCVTEAKVLKNQQLCWAGGVDSRDSEE